MKEALHIQNFYPSTKLFSGLGDLREYFVVVVEIPGFLSGALLVDKAAELGKSPLGGLGLIV